VAQGDLAWRFADTSSGRPLVALHPSLDARYTWLVAAVAADVESCMSPVVVANRLTSWSIDPPQLRFRPWRDERAAFAERLDRLAEDARCLVFADVRDCYRSIRPRVVGRTLVTLGCDALLSAAIVAFLRRLEMIGVAGLPVGPQASPVLANAVLGALDRELAAAGLRHLRWVDDVVVAVRDAGQADGVLSSIGTALARLGLVLNERKTRIVLDASSVTRASTVSTARDTASHCDAPAST
jgi:Reverse transcriptase (RNA-dependent DNA polymerase)